eukprot:TRINITY_DN7407_c0_g2_i1.p1 TRINITY_DN7407_c0_g2~~TRINITY_DN7407_c0_g2_i1.p1  ORF type:complete len:779 (+),score=142.14 TRINITY_DN7407_c0_g2_i1:134-2338(+)
MKNIINGLTQNEDGITILDCLKIHKRELLHYLEIYVGVRTNNKATHIIIVPQMKFTDKYRQKMLKRKLELLIMREDKVSIFNLVKNYSQYETLPDLYGILPDIDVKHPSLFLTVAPIFSHFNWEYQYEQNIEWMKKLGEYFFNMVVDYGHEFKEVLPLYISKLHCFRNYKEIITNLIDSFYRGSEWVDLFTTCMKSGISVSPIIKEMKKSTSYMNMYLSEKDERSGYTLLMIACKYDSLEAVLDLLLVPIYSISYNNGHYLECEGNDTKTALMIAAQYLPEAVEHLVLAGCSIDTIEKNGNNALIIAAEYNPEAAITLIYYGSDINQVSIKKNTCLSKACIYHPELVELFIENGARVHPYSHSSNFYPLSLACQYNPHLVECLIDGGSDIEYRNKKGFTPLMIASLFQPEAITVLLDAGAKIEYGNGFLNPLMVAARYELDSIKILISFGANLDLVNDSGSTALMIASRYHPGIAQELLQSGACCNICDNLGNNALIIASRYQHNIIDDIFEECNNLENINDIGNTALLIAARYNSKSLGVILNLGGNVHHKNDNGETALMIACKYSVSSTELLLPLSDLDEVDSRGYSAIMIAAKYHPELVHKILEYNVNLNICGLDGYTLLHICVLSYHLELVKILALENLDRSLLRNIISLARVVEFEEAIEVLTLAGFNDEVKIYTSADISNQLKRSLNINTNTTIKLDTEIQERIAFRKHLYKEKYNQDYDILHNLEKT